MGPASLLINYCLQSTKHRIHVVFNDVVLGPHKLPLFARVSQQFFWHPFPFWIPTIDHDSPYVLDWVHITTLAGPVQ